MRSWLATKNDDAAWREEGGKAIAPNDALIDVFIKKTAAFR
jgi:hypothetical protein